MEELVGPATFHRLQQTQHQFLRAVAVLYGDALSAGGHDHARDILSGKLQTLTRRLGIVEAGDALEVRLRWGAEAAFLQNCILVAALVCVSAIRAVCAISRIAY